MFFKKGVLLKEIDLKIAVDQCNAMLSIKARAIKGRDPDNELDVNEKLKDVCELVYKDNILNKWDFLCGEPLDKGVEIRKATDRIKESLFMRGYNLTSFELFIPTKNRKSYHMFYMYNNESIQDSWASGTVSFH